MSYVIETGHKSKDLAHVVVKPNGPVAIIPELIRSAESRSHLMLIARNNPPSLLYTLANESLALTKLETYKTALQEVGILNASEMPIIPDQNTQEYGFLGIWGIMAITFSQDDQ